MPRPMILTDEQRRANKNARQKKYLQKVFAHHKEYKTMKEDVQFTTKCLRRSILVNGILLITSVLGRIL